MGPTEILYIHLLYELHIQIIECVPEEVTAEIVSLKDTVAEKTADIKNYSARISLLEEQLKVSVYEHKI